jgi:hypothetical protein
MAYPTNTLQVVKTFQNHTQAAFENVCYAVKHSNKKFNDIFTKSNVNLGDSVSFEDTYFASVTKSLIPSFEGQQQRALTIQVDQAANSAFTSYAQERLFQLEKNEYMEKVGKARAATLAWDVESNVLLGVCSQCPVMQTVGGVTTPTGALHSESGPYRIFGNGVTAINSYQQLRQMIVNFNELGYASKIHVVLPSTVVPTIIGTGFSQFVPKRNDEKDQSWELGTYGGAEWFESNLMPTFYAGDAGQKQQTLTVYALGAVDAISGMTSITFSGFSTSTSNVVVPGDIITFTAASNLRMLPYRAKVATSQLVSVRVVSAADSDGSGRATVTFMMGEAVGRGIVSSFNAYQNVNIDVAVGMTAVPAQSHKCGLLIAEDSLFMAMPKLPSQEPYPSHAQYNEATGASVRCYWGNLPFQNVYGWVVDEIHGSLIHPRYSMRIAFPLATY